MARVIRHSKTTDSYAALQALSFGETALESVDSAEQQVTSQAPGEQLSRPSHSVSALLEAFNEIMKGMGATADKSANIRSAGSVSTSSVTDSPVVEAFPSGITRVPSVLSQRTSGLLPPLPFGEYVLTGKQDCYWPDYLGSPCFILASNADVVSLKEQPPIARLTHGLDRVLFKYVHVY